MTQDERLKAIEDDIESGGITSENLVWIKELVKVQREALEKISRVNFSGSAINYAASKMHLMALKALEWEG